MEEWLIISFIACMEFMQKWTEENNKYIARWSTEKGMLYFYTDADETFSIPLAMIMQR